jgi:hypothetical protein
MIKFLINTFLHALYFELLPKAAGVTVLNGHAKIINVDIVNNVVETEIDINDGHKYSVTIKKLPLL